VQITGNTSSVYDKMESGVMIAVSFLRQAFGIVLPVFYPIPVTKDETAFVVIYTFLCGLHKKRLLELVLTKKFWRSNEKK